MPDYISPYFLEDDCEDLVDEVEAIVASTKPEDLDAKLEEVRAAKAQALDKLMDVRIFHYLSASYGSHLSHVFSMRDCAPNGQQVWRQNVSRRSRRGSWLALMSESVDLSGYRCTV